jgi:hypothetical protein
MRTVSQVRGHCMVRHAQRMRKAFGVAGQTSPHDELKEGIMERYRSLCRKLDIALPKKVHIDAEILGVFLGEKEYRGLGTRELYNVRVSVEILDTLAGDPLLLTHFPIDREGLAALGRAFVGQIKATSLDPERVSDEQLEMLINTIIEQDLSVSG